ncbi:MAG TPA: hypothetical protein VN282_09800 [Pyrinomonadaceae bacterium]|nr:hypothetical protein [Pyrinomonadaceae bacterium]
MKLSHARSLPAAAACATLLCLALCGPAATFAQGPGQGRPTNAEHAPQPTQPSPIPRAPSVRERQLMMDEMSREMGKGPAPRKSEELRMTEVAEDYRDLQQVNNKMMASAMRAAEPDYKTVAGALADIRRRAERLRENLALPAPPEKDEKRPEPKPFEDAKGMKAALLALDRSIMSFVRSPLFKNTGVLDADAAARAARDLNEVIERSRLASKDAEKLAKKGKD